MIAGCTDVVLCLCIDSMQQFTLATVQNLIGSSTCDVDEGAAPFDVYCVAFGQRDSVI